MNTFKRIMLVIFSLVFISVVFLGFEIALRVSGKKPISLKDWNKTGESLIFEQDSLLGWKLLPGVYDKWPEAWSNNKGLRVTVWPDGSRAVRPVFDVKDKRIVLIGCSFTFGWAISDQETFAWKVQQEFPDLQFLNYGTNAYGTYQSLLFLERYLQEHPAEKPFMVMYGFASFHESRNVASYDWLRTMRISRPSSVPYCAINNAGQLQRHPAISYDPWPLSRYSVIIDYLQSLVWRLSATGRVDKKEEVTKALLVEMDGLCKKRGIPFVVLILAKAKSGEYKKFLKDHDIRFVDCVPQGVSGKRLSVRGDGHPNGLMNSLWAMRISDCLRKEAFFREK